MKLYSYWRSSCSFRVRIALNLKGTFFLSLFLRIILFLFILPSILIFLHLFFDYDWSIDRLGLKYEYKAVNLLKGEQFSPGEKENRISISIRWPLLYFTFYCYYSTTVVVFMCACMYVCMYVWRKKSLQSSILLVMSPCLSMGTWCFLTLLPSYWFVPLSLSFSHSTFSIIYHQFFLHF